MPEPNPHRTSDGYVRADHLRRGAIDQRGWKVDHDWHIVRLQLRRARPELWEVHHRITHHPPEGPASLETDTQLFNKLTEARQHFKSVRRNPPTSYPTAESAA